MQVPIPKTLMLIEKHPRLSEICSVCTVRQKQQFRNCSLKKPLPFHCLFLLLLFCLKELYGDSGHGSWLKELGGCTFPRECHHTFFSATCLICSSDCCLLAGYPGGGSDWYHSPSPTSGIMNSYSEWQAELRSWAWGGAGFKWSKVCGMRMWIWLCRIFSLLLVFTD